VTFPAADRPAPLEPEWMDAPAADPRQLERSLGYIRRVNRLFGYTRATLWHLEQLSRGWTPGQRVRILDVATGSADVPRAILRWAGRRGFDVRVVGIDLHQRTVDAAVAACARAGSDPSTLHVVQADALRLPFPNASFDYATTSMFLHHLETDAAEAALLEMARVSRRGVIVSDLLRHRRAYAWITVLTLLANPMVRHDARLSVAQAFSREEVIRLRDRAGLGFATYHTHFGHRFVLSGERSNTLANRAAT
jgi:ubiquinone/menaquinone biosynthesis C-methylase UbiE